MCGVCDSLQWQTAFFFSHEHRTNGMARGGRRRPSRRSCHYVRVTGLHKSYNFLDNLFNSKYY